MNESLLAEMKHYIGFDDRDGEALRGLAPYVRSAVPIAVDRFYDAILIHPGARAVITGGEEQLERLRQSLLGWVSELFDGRYDQEYFAKHEEIGRVHVRVGLPQHYMFTSMEILRQELDRVIRASGQDPTGEKMTSLHKLLTLELGIMVESYKEGFTAQVRHIERSLVQDRLTRAEHLAEIGSLAASIAHEVKNPLAGVSGAIQVIRNGMSADDPHRPIIAEILRQIDRLDSAVKDLLLYARPHPPRVQPCDLDATVRRVLKILREEPDMQRLKVEFSRDPNLSPIRADENQLEQVIINLLQNAVQASDDGDTIFVRISGGPDQVFLLIEDEGEGIPPDVYEHIFDPFYTTKAKGTGLGLNICRKIIEAHSGEITVQSKPGRGTIVTVRLPINADA